MSVLDHIGNLLSNIKSQRDRTISSAIQSLTPTGSIVQNKRIDEVANLATQVVEREAEYLAGVSLRELALTSREFSRMDVGVVNAFLRKDNRTITQAMENHIVTFMSDNVNRGIYFRNVKIGSNRDTNNMVKILITDVSRLPLAAVHRYLEILNKKLQLGSVSWDTTNPKTPELVYTVNTLEVPTVSGLPQQFPTSYAFRKVHLTPAMASDLRFLFNLLVSLRRVTHGHD